MKFYVLKRVQVLPTSLTDAWTFFATPRNLAQLTPQGMEFTILHATGGEAMYAGQVIRYRVRIFPGYTVHWVSEITHVQEPNYFVDTQLAGPYAVWHHEHHFRQVRGGVEVTDEVTYAIPWGVLGRLAHGVFVERRLNAIFDYRRKVLEAHFSNGKSPVLKTA